MSTLRNHLGIKRLGSLSSPELGNSANSCFAFVIWALAFVILRPILCLLTLSNSTLIFWGKSPESVHIPRATFGQNSDEFPKTDLRSQFTQPVSNEALWYYRQTAKKLYPLRNTSSTLPSSPSHWASLFIMPPPRPDGPSSFLPWESAYPPQGHPTSHFGRNAQLVFG